MNAVTHLEDIPEVGGDRGEDDLVGLEGGPVGAGQGHVHKVLAGVEVAEGGGHVHREVVPLEAVLLSDAHGGGVCVALATCKLQCHAHYGSTLRKICKNRRKNCKKKFRESGL